MAIPDTPTRHSPVPHVLAWTEYTLAHVTKLEPRRHRSGGSLNLR